MRRQFIFIFKPNKVPRKGNSVIFQLLKNVNITFKIGLYTHPRKAVTRVILCEYLRERLKFITHLFDYVILLRRSFGFSSLLYSPARVIQDNPRSPQPSRKKKPRTFKYKT